MILNFSIDIYICEQKVISVERRQQIDVIKYNTNLVRFRIFFVAFPYINCFGFGFCLTPQLIHLYPSKVRKYTKGQIKTDGRRSSIHAMTLLSCNVHEPTVVHQIYPFLFLLSSMCVRNIQVHHPP